jgi:nitrite reductase/ring-hydroxylating ferredoxin subunit/uncharacterized membrane protein
VRREQILHRLESEGSLDGLAERLAPLARRVTGSGARRDLLTGSWLGHPLHPTAVMVPLSCFVSTSVLDVVGGQAGRRVARRLLGLGIASAVPAAAAGLADWTDTSGAERRVGVVHAAANAVAVGLYAVSWRQRGRGAAVAGAATALLGTAITGAAGYLGGHLAYRRGVGVDTTAFNGGPAGWRPIGRVEELPSGQPVRVDVDGVALVAVRHDGSVSVLEARCTHRGGPLDQGELSDGCLTCPWHGSRFAVETGQVVQGPATAPAPAYEVRVDAGTVEVRRPEPDGLRRIAATEAEGSRP